MSGDASQAPFAVVGIGASAGGIEALVELIGALPVTGNENAAKYTGPGDQITVTLEQHSTVAETAWQRASRS